MKIISTRMMITGLVVTAEIDQCDKPAREDNHAVR